MPRSVNAENSSRLFRRWALRLAVLAALFIPSVALAACDGGDNGGEDSAAATNGGEPVQGGTLTFARSLDAEAGLNPINAPNNGSIFTIQQIFDQLVEIEDGDTPVPGLAESWKTSDDGLQWTFQLRKAQFSNGDPVTAEDVKFSIDRFADPEVNVAYASMGEAIEEVEVVDDRTVRINLSTVDGAFLDAISMFAAAIVPKKVVEQVGDKAFAENPVGSGPFMVTEFTRGQRTVLERNPHYWREGQPYLDRVIFEFVPDANTRTLQLRSGQADVADAIPYNQVEALQGTDGITVQIDDSLKWDSIYFNTKEPPLDEVEVVRALNYATPKEQILETVLFGHAEIANSNISPVKYWDESIEPYPYDLERAQELLSKSSVPDGFDLELLIPSGDPVEQQTAEIVKAEWAKIGVNVSIVPRDFGTLFTAWLEGKGAGQAATFPGNAISSDTLAEDSIAALIYDPEAGLSALGTFYDNPEVTKLLAEAQGATDEKQRAEIFAEIQQITLDDYPAVPLFFSKAVAGVRDNVMGFQTYPIGWWPLREVWLSE